MTDDASKEKYLKKPVEKHETAAWANIEETQPVSNVAVPHVSEVRNAKDWVDANQK